jgi:hypothetical protein
MRDVVAPFGFDHLADAASIGGEAGSSFGIDEEATVDALLAWVARSPRAEPFLGCYLPIAGHHPYASPPGGPFDRTTQLGCYKNALHYADRALQRLHAGLCRLRAPEELLLCVVGDHGQAFGEHAGNFGHSLEVYEENLRVPLLFWAPGALANTRTDAVCSHLDVVPTLFDLLGLTLPLDSAAPGRSLLRLPLRGGRLQAFTDWGELLLAARDGDWKYVLEVATGRERLFDLRPIRASGAIDRRAPAGGCRAVFAIGAAVARANHSGAGRSAASTKRWVPGLPIAACRIGRTQMPTYRALLGSDAPILVLPCGWSRSAHWPCRRSSYGHHPAGPRAAKRLSGPWRGTAREPIAGGEELRAPSTCSSPATMQRWGSRSRPLRRCRPGTARP